MSSSTSSTGTTSSSEQKVRMGHETPEVSVRHIQEPQEHGTSVALKGQQSDT